METTWVGRSVARVGGVERVTGTQQYVADIHVDNVLHVKLVHLNCARARIAGIDTADAARVEGVRCIMTAADLPQPVPRYGPVHEDRPVLAVGETKFFGEPVAAVAAETEDAAEAAAALIRVDHQELPAVLSVDAALDPAAPLVQDPSLRANDPLAQTNILHEWQFGWGALGDTRADCIVENDYSFPMVTHFAIEPHGYLAAPDPEGVTIWSPIQHPYVLQRVVASTLGWPVSRVRVIAPDPGGGFGGKGWPKFEPLMAFLALRTGRSVRLVLTLEETFQQVRRTSARAHVRTGFDLSGRIVFQDIHADFLVGAYADIGGRVVSKAGYAACGPYRTPHARITARAVLSHHAQHGVPGWNARRPSEFRSTRGREARDRSVEIRPRNVPAREEATIPGDTPADGDRKAFKHAAREIDGMAGGQAVRGISLGRAGNRFRHVASCLHYDLARPCCPALRTWARARERSSQIGRRNWAFRPTYRCRDGHTSVALFDSSTGQPFDCVLGNAIASLVTSRQAETDGGGHGSPSADTVTAGNGPLGGRELTQAPP